MVCSVLNHVLAQLTGLNGGSVIEFEAVANLWDPGAFICQWERMEELAVLPVHDQLLAGVRASPCGGDPCVLPLLGRPRHHHQQYVHYRGQHHFLW